MGVGPSSLHEAARAGDARQVQRLLRLRQGGVNELEQGLTPMLIAVKRNDHAVVSVLLRGVADPNTVCYIHNHDGDAFMWMALHEACRKCDIEIIQELLDFGADINAGAYHDMAPLHIAVWHGRQDVIQILIEEGCDVNKLDLFQESPLVIAIYHGDITITNMLLEAGCRLNVRSWGNMRKIRGKHETDYRMKLYGRHGPFTLLMLAVQYCWLSIAILLLRHGFNPNKYQVHDLLSILKHSTGCIDAQGRQLISCFLAAGYRFRRSDEQLLNGFLENGNHEYGDAVIRSIKDMMTTPATLMHLSRTTIRNHLRSVRKHTSIISAIRQFPIPTSLIEFLQLSEYQNIDQSEDCIKTYELSEQLYFAMPRKRRRAQRHPYIQFWLTSCGFNK